VNDELRLHWALHEIDEEAVRHEAERGKLPEQRRALDARVTSERNKLAAIDTEATKLERRRRELERDIAGFEAQEKRFKTQLDAVTDQKQYTAVQHEIATVAGKRSDLETEALTVMDGEERAATDRPHAAELLAKAERETADTRAKLDAEEARHSSRLAELDARRAEAIAQLEPPMRSRYERTRAARAGRAVAAIEKGACGGCFRGLAPHGLQEARKREHMVLCDGCGRLLMLPPEDAAPADPA
jgi:predicted  nucleic acid-binding Zn-ribbon protein